VQEIQVEAQGEWEKERAHEGKELQEVMEWVLVLQEPLTKLRSFGEKININ
jgi:hypothetical protein